MKKSLILLTVLLTAFSAFSSQYYVNAARPDNSGSGTSWGTAKKTIKAAVKLAKNGDTVWVTNGTYSIAAEISVTNAITIRSVNGPEVTIVDGGGITRCFNLHDSACLISGFTIQNGSVPFEHDGGGILCQSTNPIVSGCLIVSNGLDGVDFFSANYGGGMKDGTAVNCIFRANKAEHGGGLANGYALNCTFENNYTEAVSTYGWDFSDGGGMLGGDAYNCVFIGNDAYFGGGKAGGTAYNCLFIDNYRPLYGANAYNCTVVYTDGFEDSAVINGTAHNTIFWNCTVREYHDVTLSDCCASNLIHGVNGNITNAPLFVDAANGDFRLQSNSPCINAGDNSTVSTTPDLAGNPRILDSTVDMGAYEYNTNTHRIATTAGVSGTITPVNPDVAQGYDQTFSIQPSAGYAIASLIIDGVPVKAASSYTFTRVQSAHTIAATYTVDSKKPTVVITAPTAGLRVTNAVYTVRGTAADNKTVSGVLVQVNGGTWINAVTANGWKNWSVVVPLKAGPNTVRTYSVDSAANNSLTSSVTCVYVVAGSLTLQTNGFGTVTRTPAGVPEVGKMYTLTATPKAGFGFREWTGDVTSTSKVIKFIMTPNKTVTANFIDIKKPTVAIAAPTAALRMLRTNALIMVRGTAADNKTVTNVQVQFNGGSWESAGTTNGWKNWSLPVTLTPGTNTIRAYSVDAAGNRSAISRVVCTYVQMFTLADYYPLPQGAEWLYDGTDEYGNPAKIRHRVISTHYPIVNYTGRSAPRGYTTNCVRMSCAYLNRTTLAAYETWNVYVTGNGQYGELGGDFDGDAVRFDRGLAAPLQMGLGQTASLTRDAYFNGQFVFPVTASLKVIGKTSITVPAGTFTDVLHMRFTMTFPDGSKTVNDEWLAKSIGKIKCVGISADDLSNYELIQYSLPSASSTAASGPVQLGDTQSFIADSIFDPQAAITVDGLIEDWTDVPRSSFSYLSGGNLTATQEVSVALSGNNVALLLTGCPFDTNDNVLVYFKLRLTYGDGDNRHSVDLWTSGSALYGMIDGLALAGLEAVLSNGVLEVKFPVPDGQTPSQIILDEAGCGMDLGDGTLTELFRFPAAAPSETSPYQQFPR